MSIANYEEVAVFIAPGASLSAPIAVNARTPLWISTPAGLTGTVLTFVAVGVGGDEVIRDSAGAEVSLTLGAAGSRHSLMPAIASALAGHREIRVRAGTFGSPALQSGGATLVMGLRTVL